MKNLFSIFICLFLSAVISFSLTSCSDGRNSAKKEQSAARTEAPKDDKENKEDKQNTSIESDPQTTVSAEPDEAPQVELDNTASEDRFLLKEIFIKKENTSDNTSVTAEADPLNASDSTANSAASAATAVAFEDPEKEIELAKQSVNGFINSALSLDFQAAYEYLPENSSATREIRRSVSGLNLLSVNHKPLVDKAVQILTENFEYEIVSAQITDGNVSMTLNLKNKDFSALIRDLFDYINVLTANGEMLTNEELNALNDEEQTQFYKNIIEKVMSENTYSSLEYTTEIVLVKSGDKWLIDFDTHTNLKTLLAAVTANCSTSSMLGI